MSTFLLLGSGEFEPWGEPVERRALEGAGGDGSVVILPTASASEGDPVFDRWARMGLDHFGSLGIPSEVLPVKRHDDAMRTDLAARIEAASMVYVSGGKPQFLASVVRDTPVWDAVLVVLARGGVYAGCSAGAMVASQSRDDRRGRGGGTGWRFGLGLVPNVTFGVHWDKASRIPGVAWFMRSRLPSGSWFVGIDEFTAILGDGVNWEVAGRGTVTIRPTGGTAVTYPSGERFALPSDG